MKSYTLHRLSSLHRRLSPTTELFPLTLSFCATYGNIRKNPMAVPPGFDCRNSLFEKLGWTVFIQSRDYNAEDAYSFDRDATYFLVGQIQNIDEIRNIVSIYTSDALTATPVQLIYLMQKILGAGSFGLIEGSFNFIRFGANGEVMIAADCFGLQPASLVFGQNIWITSELKTISLIEPHVFEFEDDDNISTATCHDVDFTPIRNVRKVKPGTTTYISSDQAISAIPFLQHQLQNSPRISETIARKTVYDLLFASTKNGLAAAKRIAVPLSGGLDSSMITALARKTDATIDTFSIGTASGNEFPFARVVSNHLGTAHKEMLLSDEDIINGIHDAIFYNEIYDGLSAEIQSGFMCLFRLLNGKYDRILTGYGADLLFGGVLKPGNDAASVNDVLLQQVLRTRWTGEFSPFGAAHFGVQIVHPFWTPRIFGLSLNLPPEMKLSLDEVKPLLRQSAEAHQLLPKETIWRKKIGIHEGSSVMRIFADYIGVRPSDYEGKTRYAYSKFRSFLQNDADKKYAIA